MSIKNSIRFVEYSSVFALCAFLLMVLGLVGSESSHQVNFWLLGLSAILFLIYFFKNQIIAFRLQHSKYRNLFCKVIEKIHLTENISMNTTVMPYMGMEDPRKGTGTADDFIKENGLYTQVGKGRTQERFVWGTIIFFMITTVLASKFFRFGADNTTLLIILGIMFITFGFLFGNYGVSKTKDISIEFTKETLNINQHEIAWTNVIDWQYNRRDSTNNASISIFYFNSFLDIESETIELFQVNIRKIDLVLLLTHFKEKYGKNIY